MDLSSSTLKTRAKQNLKEQYGQSIVVTLIYTCIVSLCSGGTFVSAFKNGISYGEAFGAMEGGSYSEMPFNVNVSFSPFSSIGSLALFLLSGPLMVGMAHYFLHVADRNNPQISDMFGHFKNFGNTFVLYLLTMIFTCLWSLLFIIPGIIAAISYSMAPFILAEHPEIKASDAIKMSKEMMKGHKGEYFMLHLSFIGWYLLCILTVGIGFIFLSPYVETASAEFFNEVSGKNREKQLNGFDPNAGAPVNGGYNGYAQPNDTNGFAQPGNGYNGYSQPSQPQNYNGYSQPAQPQNYNGYSQPAQP